MSRLPAIINIGSASVAAFVAFYVDGMLGQQLGAVIPAVMQETTAKRFANVEDMVAQARGFADLDGAALVEWARESDRNAQFFTAAIEAAWETLDPDKLRTLAYVLADGVTDDAKMDSDQLLIIALRELQPGHVRVLRTLAEKPSPGADRTRTWSTPELRAEQEHLGVEEVIDPILATLQRLGCILAAPNFYPGDAELFETEQNNLWVASKFGLLCLDVLRKAAIGQA